MQFVPGYVLRCTPSIKYSIVARLGGGGGGNQETTSE